MDNFETHPRGTAEELKHLRSLVKEVEVYLQYGVLPDKVTLAYNILNSYYVKQLEMEKR